MSTKLITKNKGLQSFSLPDCPKCKSQPTSDFVSVLCSCHDAIPESPVEYIKRCESYKPRIKGVKK